MEMFQSEQHLVETLEDHDEMIRQCVDGRIGLADFCRRYDDFYFQYALDGHESDPEEKSLLEKYRPRIARHAYVAQTLLGGLCPGENTRPFPPTEAGRLAAMGALRQLVQTGWQTPPGWEPW